MLYSSNNTSKVCTTLEPMKYTDST